MFLFPATHAILTSHVQFFLGKHEFLRVSQWNHLQKTNEISHPMKILVFIPGRSERLWRKGEESAF